MVTRRIVLAGVAAAASLAFVAPAASAEGQIKIGEINSYSRLPAFTVPYRNGWKLALDEINASGGIKGRKLVVISRDDAGKPGNAVKIAAELVAKDKVTMLMGTFFSHIGLAVADYAGKSKTFFLAAEPLTDAIVWKKGNRYTFRLRPSTHMQSTMLAEQAAKLKLKRWATIAPNYAYGKDAVAAFVSELKRRQPGVEIVVQQWPKLFKIDAGAEVQALMRAKPQGIYNVTFGGDLAKFVREGNIRGLFKGRKVASLLTGEPEYLDGLKKEAPTGWIVTGYPWYAIKTAAHTKFLKAYRARFKDYPRTGSLVGYNVMLAAAAILRKTKSHDAESLIAAARGITISSPSGPFTFRAIDHQSTMGAWVGLTAVSKGKGIMVKWRYTDGAAYLPGDDVVKKLRPAAAMK